MTAGSAARDRVTEAGGLVMDAVNEIGGELTHEERVLCENGHTRPRCTNAEAVRRSKQIDERNRLARMSGEIICGLCRCPGHDRSTCPERRWP